MGLGWVGVGGGVGVGVRVGIRVGIRVGVGLRCGWGFQQIGLSHLALVAACANVRVK